MLDEFKNSLKAIQKLYILKLNNYLTLIYT